MRPLITPPLDFLCACLFDVCLFDVCLFDVCLPVCLLVCYGANKTRGTSSKGRSPHFGWSLITSLLLVTPSLNSVMRCCPCLLEEDDDRPSPLKCPTKDGSKLSTVGNE